MSLQLAIDLLIAPGAYAIVRAQGRLDRTQLTCQSVSLAWKAFAEEVGFSVSGRTPAREAYEDGWYEVRDGGTPCS